MERATVPAAAPACKKVRDTFLGEIFFRWDFFFVVVAGDTGGLQILWHNEDPFTPFTTLWPCKGYQLMVNWATKITLLLSSYLPLHWLVHRDPFYTGELESSHKWYLYNPLYIYTLNKGFFHCSSGLGLESEYPIPSISKPPCPK